MTSCLRQGITCITLIFGMCAALKLPGSAVVRRFVPITAQTPPRPAGILLSNLRVQQFNVLADGLSGLRPDLGGFSRVGRDVLMWENRKWKILDELLRFKPDVITLQECDHYDDFFLPELAKQGYDGTFAPKPASACLKVSDRSDGCAIFVHTDKLRFVSTEIMLYGLPPEEEEDVWEVQGTHAKRESHHSRRQNQVALTAVCELYNADPVAQLMQSVPIIIATTHLKAAKTVSGEKERLWQAKQLLESLSQLSTRLLRRDNDNGNDNDNDNDPDNERGDSGPLPCTTSGSSAARSTSGLRSVPIILTGDLNATPNKKSGPSDYESLVYPFIKRHALRFRSVMNDDLPAASVNDGTVVEHTIACPPGDNTETALHKKKSSCSLVVWTSWKTRWRAGQELVAKHCIDYILYCTADQPLPNAASVSTNDSRDIKNTTDSEDSRRDGDYNVSVRAVAVLDTPDDEAVGPEMLPSAVYPSDHISLVADFQVLLEQHN